MTETMTRLPTDAVHDLALADREPDIPRFLDVLSPARAIASLHDQLPRSARIPDDPRVVYLRYKPGVSLTAAIACEEPEPLVFLQAVSLAHRPKVEKLLAKQHHGPSGWGVVSDPGHLLALGVPASDRHLPGLRKHGRFVDLPRFRPLRYKPHRRWVGKGRGAGRQLVVRVVPPTVAELGAPTLRHLEQAALLPNLRQHPRRGISVHDWVEGRTLAGGTADLTVLAEVGRTVAGLHTLPLGPVRPGPDHRISLRHAADSIGVLCPDLAAMSHQLAGTISARLPAYGPLVVSHGDLSDDQVVIGPDGRIRLIDFDRVCLDHPAFDLGSFLSQQLVTAGETGADARTEIDTSLGRFNGLLAGYRTVATVPDTESIMACALAALLRRAVDPFRQRQPGWSEGIARRIELVDQLMVGPG